MFQSPETMLKLKIHSRHLYLGYAAWAMRKGDISDMHANLGVVERFQADIEAIEQELQSKNQTYL